MKPGTIMPVLRTGDENMIARYALGHGQGLIFAYEVGSDGQAAEIGVDKAEMLLAQGRGLVWVHLDITTTPAKRWVETRDFLPEAAKDILLTREDHTQFQILPGGLAGIIGDFHLELEAVDWRVGKLHLYADANRFITARRHPLAAVERAQKALLKGEEARSGVALFGLVVEALAALLDDASDDLGNEIERIEDYIESGRAQTLRASLGEARKRSVLFHRQINAERRVMARLCAKPPVWFHDDDTMRLRETFEHLGAIGEALDTLGVRAKLLQDELASRLAEATNRNLYVLSVVSAILLPMTLVTGIFGMNLGGLPGLDSPQGFWGGVGLTGAVGLVTLLVLRALKIL